MKVATDKILVKLQPIDTVTSGGLLIPSKVKSKGRKATVLSYGNLVESIQEGDTVIINERSGTRVEAEGVDHIIIINSDVLAILQNNQ